MTSEETPSTTTPTSPSSLVGELTVTPMGASPPSPTAPTHDNLMLWTSRAADLVTNPKCSWLVMLMLGWHLIVHLWIGAEADDPTAWLQGFMYFSNYCGVALAFAILLRLTHHRTVVGFRIKRRLSMHEHHFDLFDHIANECHSKGMKVETRLKRFCRKWDRRALVLAILWLADTLRNAVLLGLTENPPDALAASPLGLWGYFNLSGQLVAICTILPVATFFTTGFYELKIITQVLHRNLALSRRENAEPIFASEVDRGSPYTSIEQAREDYLFVQRAYAQYATVWSTPIATATLLCTQVIVSEILFFSTNLRMGSYMPMPTAATAAFTMLMPSSGCSRPRRSSRFFS